MPNGVAFTHDAARRIIASTLREERRPRDMAGEKNRRGPQEASFFAYLSTGGGMNGLFWSWVRVVPVAKPPAAAAATIVMEDPPLWEFAQPIASGYQNAREANNNRNVPTGTVTLLTFVGYDDNSEPLYVFNYSAPLVQADMGIHDHRDNVTGKGYAFSVYHPGTDLPQQPWSV